VRGNDRPSDLSGREHYTWIVLNCPAGSRGGLRPALASRRSRRFRLLQIFEAGTRSLTANDLAFADA